MNKWKWLYLFGLAVIITILLLVSILFNKKEKKMTIIIEGFEVNYSENDIHVTDEQLKNIELGCSMEQIEELLGEPNAWIGGGILRPVYFLKNQEVIVLHFKNPMICEDLKELVVYNSYGDSNVVKGSQENH